MKPATHPGISTLTIYLQQHYSSDTAKAYYREIEIYLSNYPQAATANYKNLTDYIGMLRQRYSKPSTINRIISSIKVYYDYLCNEEIRNDNPAKSIQLRDRQNRDIQLQDLFTTEELEHLFNRKERFMKLNYRNRVLISLLIYQALHPREMEAITLRDINLAEGSIYIKPSPKTNGRTLQLKPNQILMFHQYITEIRPKLLKKNSSDKLLLGERSNPMTGEDITKHVKRSFKQWYPGRLVNAQSIRKSVIANLLKQGHDISIVQAFAGHIYPSTTQRYRQNEVETLRTAINKYHPLK